MSYESKYRSGYVYLLCCSAALGGLMFGYSTSVVTGAVHSIQRYYQLTPVEVGWAVSSIIIGCIAGSLAGGKIADRIGRKATLLLAALLFILSAAGSAWFASFTLFSLSRILCGLAVGLTGTASPMYMGEISPSAIRGKASGIYNLSVGLGQIIVFIVNFFIARGMAESWLINEGWRWMMAAQLVPAVGMFLLLLFLPESPVWNVNRNNRNGKEKAAAVLRRIYPEFNAEHAGLLKADAAPGTKTNGTFSLLATSPVLKFALIVGCLIAVLQQCTGINVMMYYAPLVLQNGGGNTETVLFQTIFIALFNTLKERKYEFALLRVNGASRLQLLSLVLIESLLLCITGFIFGTVVGRVALLLISGSSETEFKMSFNPFEFVWEKEGYLLGLTIFVGILAAVIPAVKAYSLNISKTLANA